MQVMNCMYTPKSLQKRLRLLLNSSMSTEVKHMDINHDLGDGMYDFLLTLLLFILQIWSCLTKFD